MEKGNHFQLELFSHVKDSGNIKTRMPNSFLRYIWGYEKTILIIIGFLITGIVAFSFGVEKGKRLVVIKTPPPAPGQITNQPQYQAPIERQEVIKPPKIKEYIQNYTIQVATYQTKRGAEKEMAALRKKGLSVLSLSKGKYTVVCVGNFSNRDAARSLLSELKRQYQDCFIRRL